ncbi:MAG: hypothetical protein AB1758_17675 [Candidatus Eremiobacterota bacterium]
MRRGLTLMETVVSCFVLALVLIALFNIFPTSMYALKQGENQIVADQMAQSVLEVYRADSFEFLDANLGTVTLADQKLGGVTFRSDLEIFNPPGTRDDLVKGLRVTVNWTFQGKIRNVVRETWVSAVRP